MTKRIYIAACVTDGGRITEDGYREKFDIAAAYVRMLGHEPVDPTRLDHNHQRRWQDYMIEALHAMLDCDAVLALPCWKKSKGATIEVQLALRLGKEVIFDTAADNEYSRQLLRVPCQPTSMAPPLRELRLSSVGTCVETVREG